MEITEQTKDITTNKSIDFHSINDILKRVFKHDTFRSELQRDAIVEACSFSRDLFVSLPTGSGKSLIYQLPALYKNYGLAVIVSPLVALISNQVYNAKELGIPTATINSHQPKSSNQKVKTELMSKSCRLRLLYLTPETLCSDHFRSYLSQLSQNKQLKLFAIDEAHCVSSWGHEFRPDYLKLSQLRSSYPGIPIVALTATATPAVLNDIVQVLALDNPKRIVAPSFRQNLFYDVKILEDSQSKKILDEMVRFISHCLKIEIKSIDKKRSVGVMSCNGKSSSGSLGGSSQFVSAASLLTSDRLLKSKKSASGIGKGRNSSSSKSNLKAVILAKEPAKITSFFKVRNPADRKEPKKELEVIDLCSDDETVDACDNISNSPVQIAGVEVEDEGSNEIVEIEAPKFVAASEIHTDSSCNIDSSNSSMEPQSSQTKPSGVGIVYCRTKLACDDVAAYLNSKGISARAYHSSLTPKERSSIERLWMEELILVICATISFGMGIDKPNVRVVIHFNMSQSLANYYQESGRAGRDGEKAHCRLYYSNGDQNAIAFLLRKDLALESDLESPTKAHGSGSKEREKWKLETARNAMERFERMVEYCKSTNKCRHRLLAKEFDLASESSLLINGCGNSCDYCFRSSRRKMIETGSGKSNSNSKSPLRRAGGSTFTLGSLQQRSRINAIKLLNRRVGGC